MSIHSFPDVPGVDIDDLLALAVTSLIGSPESPEAESEAIAEAAYWAMCRVSERRCVAA